MVNIKTINELEELVLADNGNHSLKNLAELLLLAINDWHVISENKIENFITEFKKFYSNEITIENLSSKKINFNKNSNSWRAESGTYIIELLQQAQMKLNETNFDKIITEILKYYSK